MLEYLMQESNMTKTENGAAAYNSTGSECLDLFASAGALRSAAEEDIIRRVDRAFSESPDTAMKLVFFARDVRGGLGERRLFRIAMRRIASYAPVSVKKNIGYIAEFGRWDDILSLYGTSCEAEAVAALREQFGKDMNMLGSGGRVSLLGKWLPSINASNKETVVLAAKTAKAFGMSSAEYRKALTALRARIHIIENDLREMEYSFDYEKQPSRALYKYRKAFIRWDTERYQDFIGRAANGTAKLHTDNIAPYELITPFVKIVENDWNHYRNYHALPSLEEITALNTTWEALPDFSSDENALAVIDNSGSMYWSGNPRPAAVALSLGMYLAEHNKGAFRNHFITFSTNPRLIKLEGSTFYDRLRYAVSFSECSDTNLEAVFDLVLRAAVKNHVPQEELPSKLVIVSDMEFNSCVSCSSETVFENAKRKYNEKGYELPEVVFWNVQSRHSHLPVTKDEKGAALVSGVTPRIFRMVAGDMATPLELMNEVLGSERYAVITA